MLSHPCLKQAHLQLTKTDSDDSEGSDTDGLKTTCVLRIDEDSNLESLVLDGRRVDVQLNIAKPNMDLDCRGVNIRFRSSSAASFLPIVVRGQSVTAVSRAASVANGWD